MNDTEFKLNELMSVIQDICIKLVPESKTISHKIKVLKKRKVLMR